MNLILLNGHPGAGKSTISQALRSSIPRLAIIDVDLFRKFVSDYDNSPKDISLMWEIVHEMIIVYLKNNVSVLIDRCIDSPKDRLALQKIAKKCNAPFQEIILYTKTLNCAITRVNNRPIKKLSKNKKAKINKDLISSLRKTMLKYKEEKKIISFDTESNSTKKTVDQIEYIFNNMGN